MSFKMVSHAFRMLFSNFSDALKLSLVPFILIQAVSLAVPFLLLGTIDASSPEVLMQRGGSVFVIQFTILIASLVFGAWLAVGWHRFVLAEEYPTGYAPAFRKAEVFMYIGRLILLFVLMIAISLPFGILAAGVAAVGGGQEPSAGVIAVISAFTVVFVLFAIWLFTRWSMILPAASIGRKMGVKEAWTLTGPLGLSILWAALIVGAFTVALQLIASVFFFSTILLIIASAAAGLISTLLSVSLATTIYGVAVEGRDLT